VFVLTHQRGPLKFGDIAREHCGVETEVVSTGHQRLIPQGLIDPINGIGEEPPPAIGIRLRPQHRYE
jgi:hypothetical protein